MPRKTTGCWTCRARKKRCDDGRPACSSCVFRSIKCYGYDGAKPDWMDSGPLEMEMMRSIKLQTKASYRERRSKNSKEYSRDYVGDFIAIQPSLDRNASIPSLSSAESSFSHPGSHGFRPGDSNLSTPRTPVPTIETPLQYSEKEITMVMYYLDHVFPRMTPFFNYSAADNGRGWLLYLFLRTRPLCALAVCLADCDQKQFIRGPLSDTPHSNHDLELQHIQIVADLRDHLSQLSGKSGAERMAAAVEALACIIHLILFELWLPKRSLQDDWLMHADAAFALLSSVAVPVLDQEQQSSPTSMSSSIVEDNGIASNFPVELLSEGERSSFQYWLTIYAHLLVTAASTFGLTQQSTRLIPRFQAIFNRNQSKIRDLFGCADWVAVVRLDIAMLRDWKKHMQTAGTLSLKDLTCRAEAIEAQLREGLAIVEAGQSDPKTSSEEQKRVVTTTFIHGSILLLHIVTSGFYPNLPEIRQSVHKTLEALEYMRQTSTINIQSWPFCIAGCLALPSEYARFKALLPQHKKGNHPLVLTIWTLDIIEECWRVRESQEEGEEACDWVTAMNNLGTRLLLV